MASTKIPWATKVWNPTTGCSPVSAGCAHCYAARQAPRLRGRFGYPEGDAFKVTVHPERFDDPFRWTKPERVFVDSMGDLFHDNVPDEALVQIFDKIYLYGGRMRNHVFMILTKRPARAAAFFKRYPAFAYPITECWFGVSAENQPTLDDRVRWLLEVPAARRFVSYEPALSRVTCRWAPWHPLSAVASTNHLDGLRQLDWVVAGCETGPGRRSADGEWFRTLKDECVEAGVPFFLKQMEVGGQIIKIPELDGRVWTEFPPLAEARLL